MIYTIKPSSRFQKDVKLAQKRGYRIELLTQTIKLLAEGSALPERYKNHALSGNYAGCYECHILPDWLLVYEKDDDTLFLYLTRTGSHSDLF
ncbi:MAG: type II toxin-antitoxin system YafQ family toxin [Angelakisella sp.]